MAQTTRWAEKLGHGLAHLQHTVDGVLGWGFRTLREVGKKPGTAVSPRSHPYLSHAEKFGRGTLTFLGTLGDSYYRKYQEIKSKKVAS